MGQGSRAAARLALLAAVLLVEGCSGAGRSGEAPRGPIADAPAVRDRLLEIAEREMLPTRGDDLLPDFGIRRAWREAFPEVDIAPPAYPPDRRTVAVFVGVPDGARRPSVWNPYLLAFAVYDSRGRCAGGVITGYPRPDTFVPVQVRSAPGRCTPAAAAASFGFPSLG